MALNHKGLLNIFTLLVGGEVACLACWDINGHFYVQKIIIIIILTVTLVFIKQVNNQF